MQHARSCCQLVCVLLGQASVCASAGANRGDMVRVGWGKGKSQYIIGNSHIHGQQTCCSLRAHAAHLGKLAVASSKRASVCAYA